MSSKWFLSINENITGPLDSNQVKDFLNSNQSQHETLIWGYGQKHWVSASYWLNNYVKLSQNAEPQQIKQWHIAFEGNSYGPVNRQDLVEKIKSLDSLHTVKLWSKGMKDWVSIFEFHDVMDEVGMNRRKTPRAPIQGNVRITKDNVHSIAQLQTISEGGLGVTGLMSAQPGTELQIEIQSPHLTSSIRAKAEVRYSSESGFTGLRFTQLSMEAKATIIDYVKRSHISTFQFAA